MSILLDKAKFISFEQESKCQIVFYLYDILRKNKRATFIIYEVCYWDALVGISIHKIAIGQQ